MEERNEGRVIGDNPLPSFLKPSMVSTGGIACKEPRAESRQTPDKGLGLFATSQILPRDNIFAIIANFATVLDTARLHDTCSNCFVTVGDELNPDLSLKACAGCHVVKYCGKVSFGESFSICFPL